jgi:hypothetical protein
MYSVKDTVPSNDSLFMIFKFENFLNKTKILVPQ